MTRRTLKLPLSLAALAGGALLLVAAGGIPIEKVKAVAVPVPAVDVAKAKKPQTAVFAGGCFWGMEAVFQSVKGVQSVTNGYAGGSAATATYDQVKNENTGHAEAVKVVYDPTRVSYGTLLRVFFSVAHDPTQKGGQGPDRGPSYRSAIFPQNAEQRRVAAAYIAQLTQAKAFAKPITTKLETGSFYPAEEYHQDFFWKHPTHPYIMRWDQPKVAAFRSTYPQLAH